MRSDESFFMPHGHCYLWEPALVWVEVLANALIAGAYFAIAFTLAYLVKRGRYLPFKGMALAFGLFIVTCGVTHLLDVWVVWDPIYWTDASVRAVTAVASVGTALMLPPLVPKAIQLAQSARAARDEGVELESALRELGSVYEKARELDQLKTDFFANVSHELRTPLTLIMGPARRILRSADATAEQRADAELILDNARALLGQVDSLLDLTRLDARRLELAYERVDAAELLRAVAESFRSLAAERRVAFEVDAPGPLDAELDPERARRVLLNLLSNAFKFTPDGGAVRVRLWREGEALALTVSDSGPGIPADRREAIFERFRQLDRGAERRFGGAGLGLAIVRELVELHRGRVRAEDAEEGGARFYVELPLRAPEGAEVRPRRARAEGADEGRVAAGERSSRPPPPAEPSGPEGHPLVLVVEDDVDMNRFVREVLSGEYRTASAFDGRAGADAARAHRPDLVVSDLMMPRGGGERLLATLRASAETSSIPVLFLTARADDELRARLLREGAQDYVLKPFDADELRARAHNLVAVKRTTDLLAREVATQARDLEALAREVGRRKREAEEALEEARAARAEAERAESARDDFLRVVSHELRTPLASIALLVERLRLDERVLTPDQAHALGRIGAQIERLHELLEGILAYASVQSGRVTPARATFDVSALASELSARLRPRAAKKGLELALDAGEAAEVEGDRELLDLVLANLLGNAIKFTERGRVSLRVERRDAAVEVTVEDTGPGMTAEQQRRLFMPFQPLEPVRNKHLAGVGVGLAIVRELVTAMGGSVRVRSEPGRGTSFTVELAR